MNEYTHKSGHEWEFYEIIIHTTGTNFLPISLYTLRKATEDQRCHKTQSNKTSDFWRRSTRRAGPDVHISALLLVDVTIGECLRHLFQENGLALAALEVADPVDTGEEPRSDAVWERDVRKGMSEERVGGWVGSVQENEV